MALSAVSLSQYRFRQSTYTNSGANVMKKPVKFGKEFRQVGRVPGWKIEKYNSHYEIAP